MLNMGCGQYLRNPFFPGFWGQKWGCGLCILADYTRLYTVFPAVYCRIYCRKFLTLSNQTSRYINKCIGIDYINLIISLWIEEYISIQS